MTLTIEIALIIIFSLIGGVAAVRFRQPAVIGLIIIGAIVGPNTLGFVKDSNLTNTTIEIGAVLLLFTIGIEFSLARLFNFGIRAILIGVLKVGIVFLLSYYTSILLGFDAVVALY